jgi:hypothetical protein
MEVVMRGRRRTTVAGIVGVIVGAMVVASCTQPIRDVAVLSGDAMGGRNNGTPGSVLAQDYLIERLGTFAVGANTSAAGAERFKQHFPGGTNVVALIPGGDLANEYVVIGGHYDHLGTCGTQDPTDTICNGATDNATGSAAVLAIGDALKRLPGGPRRSVVLALWDREEDGLLGSKFYVDNPLFPLEDTVAYLNYDIQGANLLPSLRQHTFAVGTETGGARLVDAVNAAARPGPLNTMLVSSIFGQNRSDYINFINHDVPTVFFSDSTGPCYHLAQDEFEIVDFNKLHAQIGIGARLARNVVQGPAATFVDGAPLATFADAVAVNTITDSAAVDIDRFTPAQQDRIHAIRAELNAMVAAGPSNFGDDDVGTLLARAAEGISILETGPCDGFLG